MSPRSWSALPCDRGISFLVVGTPRSGTSLVQRLACETGDVWIPPETHVLSVLLPRLSPRDRFPLAGTQLRSILDRYASLPHLDGEGPEARLMYDWLDGRAEDALDLLDAAVGVTTPPGSHVRGEKTPGHLEWAERVGQARPNVGIVGVVRDPRAVSRSLMGTPWGGRDVARHAARWVQDQRLLRRLRGSFGAHRVLTLRYEDVVTAPDAARAQLADFLGVAGRVETREPSQLYRTGEVWKASVLGDVVADRRDLWRSDMPLESAAAVERIAHEEMARWGYRAEHRFRLNIRTVARAGAYACRRQIQHRRLDHMLTRSGALPRHRPNLQGQESRPPTGRWTAPERTGQDPDTDAER